MWLIDLVLFLCFLSLFMGRYLYRKRLQVRGRFLVEQATEALNALERKDLPAVRICLNEIWYRAGELGLLVLLVVLAMGAEDCRTVRPSPSWGPAVVLPAPVNSSAWEDGPSITPDGNTLYFTRGTGLNVDIYVSRKDGSGWTEPRCMTELSVPGFPTGAPHTQDNKTLFFASTRPGVVSPPLGLSDWGADLFVCRLDAAGVASNVQSVTGCVNTGWMESEPWISPDGNLLYFASNRPGGLGDLDIWYAVRTQGNWCTPVNIGPPVNTPGIETQPFVTTDGKDLYFMSVDRVFGGQKIPGPAVYHSVLFRSKWYIPGIAAGGFVGEPTLTMDEKLLYMVHLLDGGEAEIVYLPAK